MCPTPASCPPPAEPLIEHEATVATISDVAWAVAAVGAGTGVWLWLGEPEAEPATGVGVIIGPGSAGLRARY